MKKIGFLSIAIGLAIWAWGQNTIGLPEIINYSKQAYNAGTQNWDICQDRNGILYFGNNEGLLSFDGTYWKNYPIPNKTIVRSVAIGPDNKIYIGAQDEIGYFSPDASGSLVYHSLKKLIPEKYNSFADVWDIVCIDKDLFFRSNKSIFHLSAGHITVYPSDSWLFLGGCNHMAIGLDYAHGAVCLRNGEWQPLGQKNDLPPGVLITAALPMGKDSILITTLKHGIYIFSGNAMIKLRSPAMASLEDFRIYGAALIDEEHYALATATNGCIIIDKKGNAVQSFSQHEGLQNNNVLSIFPDHNKNLWLGLDNGIDFIAYNSAIKHIVPDKQNEASGYSSLIYNNKLYIATTNGLYEAPLYDKEDLSFVKSDFVPVANTKGQAWNLSEVNGKLLMGHHEGSFVIENDRAIPLENSTGYWMFLPVSPFAPSDLMAAGTYNGIKFFSYSNGRFVNNNIEAPFESARFVLVDNNSIWVSHPYKGVYRVRLDEHNRPSVELYAEKHGLTTNGNYVFKIKNRLVAATEKGIYEYNIQKDVFEPSPYFHSLLGDRPLRYLKEDPAGNIWFVFDKNIGVVDFSGEKPKVIYIPELNRKMVSGFEQMYAVNESNIFIGAERGYFHINYEKYKATHPGIQVLLRQVRANGKSDSLLFGGYFNEVNKPQLQEGKSAISYQWNSFHFEFSSPLYEQRSNIEYSYYLEGYDKKWSEWTDKTEKDYAYLPAGAYTFRVKARNNLGNESADNYYSFTILPPWYQTWWAYAFYGLAFAFTCYAVYRWQKKKFVLQQRRYEEEQKRLQYLHQLELEKNEREIITLRNDKLEAEIQHKNKEMASATMHLVKKGELITRIRDELQRLTRETEDERSLDAFKRIIKTLGEEDKMDKDWEHFTIHFDKVHNDFFIALKEKHPNLTANELKLCAYLRMNLSTKEIAQLMNISIRGVEISRYRLRKKLQVPTEINLFSYFLDFHSNNGAPG